jgi:outer membrane receptor protein involved in Fe transport
MDLLRFTWCRRIIAELLQISGIFLKPFPARSGRPGLRCSRLLICSALACCQLPVGFAASETEAPLVLEEVVVTGQRRPEPWLAHPGNIQRLGHGVLERTAAHHPHELFNRVAGAWIVRGSGQEHQTALRSPVLGGGGACGSVLFLEDGIPIRPAGFCNINQLAELATGLADAVEVVRGPGNAVHGSNALHGIVNVLMPVPGTRPGPLAALEAGANDFFRLRLAGPSGESGAWFAAGSWAEDGGFREASGYQQGKAHFKRDFQVRDGEFTLGFTATRLRQDTAGFIYGQDAYRDEALSRTNPTPEAFRNMDAQRVYGRWTRSLGSLQLDLRPYLRHSDMSFMHHALPGQPVEDNGHHSAGILSALRFGQGKLEVTAGLDADWAEVFLRQVQAAPAAGPPRIGETRPAGRHYDYRVNSFALAPFLQAEYRMSGRWRLGGGLRFEYTRYDYDNRMLSGDTREDGSPCGFGGCFYSRPGDRRDSFGQWAPLLSASYRLGAGSALFASLARGYRVPQTTELYRLQNGQLVPDLDPERIDSWEAGWRATGAGWSADITLFSMRKRDSVFRDAEGYNVSGARSRHHGIEASMNRQLPGNWWLAANATYARHSYDFDFAANRGERFESGRDMDTAPRWLGSAELRYTPARGPDLALQWVHLGSYFLEPANRFEYPGHDLLHLRAGLRVSSGLYLSLRLNNLADRRVADRADYGAGDYRYLPGRGRELFAELRYGR